MKCSIYTYKLSDFLEKINEETRQKKGYDENELWQIEDYSSTPLSNLFDNHINEETGDHIQYLIKEVKISEVININNQFSITDNNVYCHVTITYKK